METMKITFYFFLVLIACFFLVGFDFSKHSIPLDEIYSGGPPKDGIPSIDNPKFVTGPKAEEDFLSNKDRVLGIFSNGKAKAYPIRILNWHEIVNDQIGGEPIVVTFCPLCGTGMIFDSNINGKPTSFGVSGLLYQSDMLLYDRETESLWSQIKSSSVAGDLTGTRLKLLSSTQTTWKAWKKKYPDTLVLSTKTGYRRDYDKDPYQGYYSSSNLMFEVNQKKNWYHPKEKIIGIEIGESAKVYPFSELSKVDTPFTDTVGEIKVKVYYDSISKTASIYDLNGRQYPTVVGFWFAWYTFHPDTEVYKGKL